LQIYKETRRNSASSKMSFMQPSPVKYACSCGILNPINKLFFCRHCPKLRCGFCVTHEIESHFCSNCLENIPSTEVRSVFSKYSACLQTTMNLIIKSAVH